mmetsp:Transcript_11132/g.35154  ORF Transcript_11132/g.35154 Transcript_11132/m.35154 type:complete len:273 (+) Transcript_11132:231-1049(+)
MGSWRAASGRPRRCRSLAEGRSTGRCTAMRLRCEGGRPRRARLARVERRGGARSRAKAARWLRCCGGWSGCLSCTRARRSRWAAAGPPLRHSPSQGMAATRRLTCRQAARPDSSPADTSHVDTCRASWSPRRWAAGRWSRRTRRRRWCGCWARLGRRRRSRRRCSWRATCGLSPSRTRWRLAFRPPTGASPPARLRAASTCATPRASTSSRSTRPGAWTSTTPFTCALSRRASSRLACTLRMRATSYGRAARSTARQPREGRHSTSSTRGRT